MIVQMRLQGCLFLLAICAGPAISQNSAFKLESVKIEGSAIPQPLILKIAGLHMAAMIDKSGIERACQKLEESGLFGSISYRYAPGPKKGYAVTLVLADQAPLAAAAIDVPGADEDEAWQWLFAKFHRFDHQVPESDPAQKYLATELEEHLGSRMRGQHMTVRMETDLRTRKVTLSFQPDVLPRIRAVSFSGNQAVTSSELAAVLNRVAANADYTARRFATAVELNLRPVYEEHGFYRVVFAPGGPEWDDAGVSLNVAVTEGATYQLGSVAVIGENLPVDTMLAAAKLPSGKLANWKQIQQGIREMERVVKRTGFFEAAATTDRSYDDSAHVLELRVRLVKGPLYRFGEVRITGLSEALQERARQIWRPKAGDPYDYAYASEFFQAFSRVVDFRNFRKYEAVTQKGEGDHVVDIKLVFEPR